MSDLRYDTSPIGLGKNFVTAGGGFGPFMHAVVHALERAGHSRSQAVQIAIGQMKNWASGQGNVTAKTRAKAAAEVANWERLKTQAHGTPNTRDAMLETGSAGLLLPKGPTAHLYKRGRAKLCLSCGKSASALPHMAALRARRARHGVRHGGPGHLPVTGGHVNTPAQHRLATVRQMDAHTTTVEVQASKAMRRLFGAQQTATLSRLKGARGRRTIRAASPPPEGEPAPPVDAGQIFDTAFWADQTAQALQGVYDTAQSLTVSRLADSLHPGETVPQAVQTVERVLAARAATVGARITQTTYQAIAAQLAEGLQAGEPMGSLVNRVKHVFADANTARAETIARTESVGALNQASASYAQALPAGVVAYKEWIATPDERTRPAHREADGQQQNVDQPFMVGGFPLMQPGDPTGPPDDVINCRCRALYAPRRLAVVPSAA